MTTPLPEPTPLIKLHMATGIVNYYTEAQLKAYVAKREKTLTAALQAMTAERDELKADAERYRWIRECSNDSLIMYGDSYNCELMMEEELDAAIDAAMKGKS